MKRYSFLPSFDDLDDEDDLMESDASPRASTETSSPLTPSDTHLFSEHAAQRSTNDLGLLVPEDGKHMTPSSYDVDHDDDVGIGFLENTLRSELDYPWLTNGSEEKAAFDARPSPISYSPTNTPEDDDISDILEGMQNFMVPTISPTNVNDDASSEINSNEFLHFPLPPGLSSSNISAAAEEELAESPIDPQFVEPGSGRRSFVPRYYARLRPSTVVWTAPSSNLQQDFPTSRPKNAIPFSDNTTAEWFQSFEESARQRRRTRTLSDPMIGLSHLRLGQEPIMDDKAVSSPVYQSTPLGDGQLTLTSEIHGRLHDPKAPVHGSVGTKVHQLSTPNSRESKRLHAQASLPHPSLDLEQRSSHYASSSSLDSSSLFSNTASSSSNFSTGHASSQNRSTFIQSRAIRNSILKPYHVSPRGDITSLSSNSAGQLSTVSAAGSYRLQSKLSNDSRLRIMFAQTAPIYPAPIPARRPVRTATLEDPNKSFLEIEEQSRVRRISVMGVLSSATGKAGHSFRRNQQ
jgi:hypothetical protein